MSDELILSHLKKPAHYHGMTEGQWEQKLRECLLFGCDWLEHLQADVNPMPAESIVELCERFEGLQQENKKLRELLETYPALWHNTITSTARGTGKTTVGKWNDKRKELLAELKDKDHE